MSVWDAVVGQPVVADVQRAVRDAARVVEQEATPQAAGSDGAVPTSSGAMTHAWLFTGPPGSGRSVLARAFAQALQCPQQGCGVCEQCRAVRAGSHPDVAELATDGLAIKVRQVREIVPASVRRPSRGRWQIVIVEDADRLGEDAGDALLISLEEPRPRTVWMLCAPTAEDILPTIRSRSRVVQLRTPPALDVARHLVETSGVEQDVAEFAARAAQGHIGRARALATDEEARARRSAVLRLPFSVDTVPSCLEAAGALLAAAREDAARHCDALDDHEVTELRTALGAGSTGRRPRSMESAVKELEREQKLRRTRVQRDSLDRALVDVLAVYRDVLTVQLGVPGELVNAELESSVRRLARGCSPEATLRQMEAVGAAREALGANAALPLALEALALQLREG